MALEEVAQCPVCHGTYFHQEFTGIDHTTTGESFHVKHCQQCSLGITTPRPTQNDAARYYQSDSYISHAGKSRTLFDAIYLFIRSLSVRWKYSLIKPYLGSHGLLDFGCGTGSFLQEVSRHGHPVEGVEPSESARGIAAKALAVAPSLEQLAPRKYDIITLWHVLEHVYLLREILPQLKARLAAGGTLFIAVPNHQSPDARHYKELWAAYDLPRHLWHFNKQSMATLLQKEGLRVTKVIPMKLDAYYVSLLSERYKRSGQLGIIGWTCAMYNALRSNLTARINGNYSSLIFVVQP